ncbi:hydrogenase subunit [Methanosarcina mazei]|uniref:Hydrogenase subunit n=1 Tax=Methanosarcina mazei TaxID=2209 RepID=A0A0F8LW85_METMZ|nr:hydrogenase subunit [Methanosarcina mazei]KKG57912.1 hydrogenase subunit [Methanosarcina mazei]KKG63940.1 hydrogenase subunit [Methanosarcina mazei]KKG65095.1 hydrogenase subunit [Methanosarcina mazei]KKG94398.1 hydrogenase subunit [Methanosarcina mazei]KKG97560.1 hydrogenase subunit [Methanosarcina mazei]
MIDPTFLEGIIKILFVFVLISAGLIISTRNLSSVLTAYTIQSFLLASVSSLLYLMDGKDQLLLLAVLTLASKVILIPYFIFRIEEKIKIGRDLHFTYLEPTPSLLLSIGLIILSYTFLSRVFEGLPLSKLFFFGAVIGLSLTLMGMLVIFSRKRVITKALGYLSMENGVLMFGLFVTELPFIIEVLIIIDLIILVILTTILAVGMDSSIEEYRQKFRKLQVWAGGESQ